MSVKIYISILLLIGLSSPVLGSTIFEYIEEPHLQESLNSNFIYFVKSYSEGEKISIADYPNDLYFQISNSWNQGSLDQYALRTIGLNNTDNIEDSGWNYSQGDSSIIIAVVDSGINYYHPDLTDNMWVNQIEYNGMPDIDDDGNGYIDDIYGFDFANSIDGNNDGLYDNLSEDYIDSNPLDDHGHGTHVAGIISGTTNNSIGVASTCPNCSLMAVKVLNSNGDGFMGDLINAVKYAVDNGADVINMSIGTTEYGESQPLQDIITYAKLNNVIVVIAAGNRNDDALKFAISGVDDAIIVSAIDINNNKAGFSNYGDRIDITAPGVDIISTKLTGGACYQVSAGYGLCSGTSMAAPYISGIFGLIKSSDNSLSSNEMRYKLLSTSSNGASFSSFFGFGIPDTRLALTQSISDTTAPSILLNNPEDTIYVSNIADIRGTIYDENLYSIHIQIDNILSYKYKRENILNNSIVSFDSTLIPDGLYHMTITAEDKSGNTTITNKNIYIYNLNSKEIFIDNIEYNIENNEFFHIHGYNSDVWSVTYSIDSSGELHSEHIDLRYLNNGYHIITIKMVDHSGSSINKKYGFYKYSKFGDFDSSGVLNIRDVDLYFRYFELNDIRADLNNNKKIDNNDLELFLASYND